LGLSLVSIPEGSSIVKLCLSKGKRNNEGCDELVMSWIARCIY
jgi:hypothetical protein